MTDPTPEPALPDDGLPESWPDRMEMVRELRRATGLFDGAIPVSAKVAWDEAIARVREGCTHATSTTTCAYDALVQCVRDADRLRQARELAARIRHMEEDGLWITVGGERTALLDLLVDGGTDG